METMKRIHELIAQKYYPFIAVIGNYKQDKNIIVHNTDNNVVFEILHGSICRFKDEENNLWLTIPQKFVINGKRYYPEAGDVFTCDDVQYRFTTKEVIVEKAFNYFKEFKNPFYGIERVVSCVYFFENSDDKTDKYLMIYEKFKSSLHQEIDAYVSSN